ncbi:hypothetical protein PpBr36_07068 [Pyricularia pennisetigena]|uniref:hypothetical protein n=1 Tax=Pyricularia pennisetigena TaxID=1578925 RepID=UPI0011541DEF|nr:hypothetical protein PpBr36_07068 [Pyricularia pennisetigena]TLS25842.1 hypothetical protein PpBr36_07068 [Pyricularia pennisetigena]
MASLPWASPDQLNWFKTALFNTNASQPQEYVKDGYRIATSKTAQRTMVQTVFLFSGSIILLCLSSLAYILFYRNYLPDQITTIPLHLQYGRMEKPFAVASLHDRNIKDSQEYDITVSLTVPHSPANLERGNFMISLHLASLSKSEIRQSQIRPEVFLDSPKVIYSEARPALLPYTSPIISIASRVVFLGYYLLSSSSETTVLVIPLAESVVFGMGKDYFPTALLVQMDSGTEAPLRTYAASVTFAAQLSGLRWLMYRHWIASFVVFTTLFWVCSVLFMLMAWLVMGMFFTHRQPVTAELTPATIKNEPPEEDDKYYVDGPTKKEFEDDEISSPVSPGTPGTQISKGPPPSYRSGSSKANMSTDLRSPDAQGKDDYEKMQERWNMEPGAGASGYEGEAESEHKLRRRSSQKSIR